MKKIDTLVEDIYDVLATSKADDSVDEENIIEEFGESMKRILRENVLKPRDSKLLLMSYLVS